jgi:hypothetical protein
MPGWPVRTRTEHVADMMALAPAGLRVQSRSDGQGAGKAAGPWFMCRSPDTHYHLRAVLPCEIGVDIGDHEDFATAAKWANALAEACARLDVRSWWMALSAGKGIHMHIFGYSNLAPILDHHPEPGARTFEPRIPPSKEEAVREAPPCIRAIVRWLSEGKPVPHAGRFAVAAYMHHAGFSAADIANLFTRTPNYDANKTARQVESIVRDHALPFNCAGMQMRGLCIESIRNARCLHVRNPVSFLPRQVRGNDGDGDEPIPTEEARDWRWAVFNHILEVAADLCGDPDIRVDPLLVAPNDESRMFREFGAQKDAAGTDRKVLWHDSRSGLPFPPLPADRDEAYRIARERDLGIPSKPIPSDLTHLDLRWLPEGCPRTPACVTSQKPCSTCPLGA